MVVIIFRSVLTGAVGADYKTMAQELLERAQGIRGFVDFKSFVADDGEHVSIIHWESQETLRSWTDDLRHVVAQQLGRDKWYESFSVEVAEVGRSYRFDRNSADSTS